MSIKISCDNCGMKMSLKDSMAGKSGACPKCGLTVDVPDEESLDDHLSEPDTPFMAWHKRNKERVKIAIGVMFLLMVVLAVNAPPTKLDSREIERHFAWDGSHRGLTTLIKELMNDPNSYEHTETRYRNEGTHLIVTTRFRGRNGFGGMVRNTITAETDLKGKVTRVISQSQR